ncbi:MAG: hypothetical protein A2X80_07505 [Geobacteraceae bacterium GWB2_52_12]|nr:MAG: hypothetical protein A2X80_07505 [Geobacteraceae bacterium GWB2_52_12]
MDLGSHLVDPALWFFDFPVVRDASSSIFSKGKLLSHTGGVEDYAAVSLVLENGSVITTQGVLS